MLKRLTMILLLGLSVFAALAPGQQNTPCARRPKWKLADTRGVFFLDAFSEGLRGQRPAHLDGKVNASRTAKKGPSEVTSQPQTVGLWDQAISGETIESAVKELSRNLEQTVTTPRVFAGRGYQNARRQFSILATLFAITAEYNGEVRWRRDAAVARDEFARVAANAKVGTIQVYNAAKSSKANLADLIRGNRLPDQPTEPVTDWRRIVDRPPLMQQLEICFTEHLKPSLANAKTFHSQREDILVQAELVAAFAQVLVQNGMQDGDDEEYAALSKQMHDGARNIVDAVKRNNYDAASKATGNISKACSVCHESYRE